MSSSGLPSTGWLLLVKAEEDYCACAPLGGPGLGYPLQDTQVLQEAMQEESGAPEAAPASSRLQLWPVNIGNISLKRSPTPGFPRNT